MYRDNEYTRTEKLNQILQTLRSSLAVACEERDYYDELPLPCQIEMDLHQLVLVNATQWVQMRLRGEDPAKTPLKKLLEKIKAAMITWQEVRDGGKKPQSVRSIENIFKILYSL